MSCEWRGEVVKSRSVERKAAPEARTREMQAAMHRKQFQEQMEHIYIYMLSRVSSVCGQKSDGGHD